MKKVVIIGGPTGVGKSELAFHLSRAIEGGGELISCDSVQVFEGLEIGANKTAKGTTGREHLLDLVHWSESFTVANFYVECIKKIEEILLRNRTPIIVGGTGFYLDWILRGRPRAPPTDPEILKAVEDEIEAEDGNDWDKSFLRLKAVDPDYAKVILPNDYYRLKRALAVHKSTNFPLSHFKRISPLSIGESYDFRCFFITADREVVCRNIDRRCEEMIFKGLLEEVNELRLCGLTTECQAGRSIGYFQSLNLLNSSIKFCKEKDQAKMFMDFLEEFKSVTRQYSRKQENWFASKSEFKWIRRPTPFIPIDQTESKLLLNVLRAIQLPRDEFDSIDGWVMAEDSIARNLVTDQVRKRMKIYRSSSTRFTGPLLDEFIRKIVSLR